LAGASFQTERALQELEQAERPTVTTVAPTYRVDDRQKEYDVKTKRHPGTGQPMSEQEYQMLLKALRKR
jgi:hypothetical protein